MDKIKCYAIDERLITKYNNIKNNTIYISKFIIDHIELIDTFITDDKNIFFNEKEYLNYENNKMQRKALKELATHYFSTFDHTTMEDFILENEDKLKEIFDINKEK